MKNKYKNTIHKKMKTYTNNIQAKSRLLVECILNKDPLAANKVFPNLVEESEKLRQLQVKKLLLEDDQDDWSDDDSGDEGDDDSDYSDDDTDEDTDDESDDEGDDDSEDDEEDSDQEDTDTNKVIDDATEIKCQINAKIIEQLFDKISDLKNVLNDKELDETSKEFITLDTSISYYSDKLQELQAQTNPGTDQTKLQEKLDIISKALDELQEKTGGQSSDSDDVEAPEDVDDSEQSDDTDEEQSEYQDEDQSEDQEEDQEETQEQQQNDEDF